MPEDKTALVTHTNVADHAQPFPRPHLESFENPLRIQMIALYLQKTGVTESLSIVDGKSANLEDTLSVHSSYLMDSVRIMSNLGGGQLGESAYASSELVLSALQAVGGATQAAQLIVEGKHPHAFALVRPPGHHATSSTAMGLCYFNNVAIAVRKAIENPNVNRVTIIDFDDHFGNGTSEIFYGEKNVQYIGLHEYDYENYGLGHFSEVGHGKGEGTNINIPLLEMSHDISYKTAVDEIVKPAVKKFKPDLIAVSAGYDAHFSDPVGNMDVDSRTYWLLGSSIRKFVKDTPAKGSFWVLEGGYNPYALGPSVRASLEGLSGSAQQKLEDQIEREINERIVEANQNVFDSVLEAHSPYW
jgi:acetoin utilization deacetylase AcuC-like enzyme